MLEEEVKVHFYMVTDFLVRKLDLLKVVKQERQSRTAVLDTSKLSSLFLSQLSTDENGPPVIIQGMDVLLSTSTPVQACIGNQQSTEAIQEDTSYRQVLPNIPHQSLYPSLTTMGTSINTAVSPEIPFSQRAIKDIENHQRMLFSDMVKGVHVGTNTSPIQAPAKKQDARTSVIKTSSNVIISHQNKCQKILFNWSILS